MLLGGRVVDGFVFNINQHAAGLKVSCDLIHYFLKEGPSRLHPNGNIFQWNSLSVEEKAVIGFESGWKTS